MICLFISAKKKLTFVLVEIQYCPFFPYSYIGTKKQKSFILANVFSELLHSNTNLTQLTENKFKPPICVCCPTTVGSKFAKIRSHVNKQKWHYQHAFSCFAMENTF